MAYNGFAIDEYVDAESVIKQLDALRDGPVYGVKEEALKNYAVHPEHVDVANNKVRPYTKTRSAFDYII